MKINYIREVRAKVAVCGKKVAAMVRKDPSINRVDAAEKVTAEIEAGTLTFDVNEEYNRLTEQMRREY